MGRSPCCEKVGLKKGPWTPEEDQKLLAFIEQYGHGSWRALPSKAGLERCGKSCRLRWTNYLRPDIKRGKFSLQEEQTIIQLHALLGNRWSAIASHLPKRTDNEIKNYWNTHIKKRLTKMGIDPMTHKPKNYTISSGTTNVSHMAQWESARLQAEARLVRESKLFSLNTINPPSRAAVAQPTPLYLDVLKAWQARSGFLTPGGTLESPTSILNFPAHSHLGISGNLPQTTHENENIGNEIMYETIEAPNFMEGLTEIIEFEENKNYWSSVLNLIDSSDSPMF